MSAISTRPSMFGVHIPQGVALGPIVEFAPHALTSNVGIGYFVAASSFWFDNGFPWKAFDGSVTGANQSWLGTTAGVDWLSIEVGGSYVLDHYTITVNTIPEPNRAPKNWTMEGSNDGTAWTVLHTATNQTGWTSGQVRSFTVSGAGYYSIFRVNITANNGDGTYTQISELHLYGSAYDATEATAINTGHALAANLAAVVPLYEGTGLTATDVLNARTSAPTGAGTIRWLENEDQRKVSVAFNGNAEFGGFGAGIANYTLQTFSCEALVFAATTAGPFAIWGTGDAGIELRIYSGRLNLLKARTADMGSSSGTLTAGVWVHVGVTYDGATVRFYINGAASGTSAQAQTFANKNFAIGSDGGSAEKIGFGSRVAYLYVWKNRVLALADFATLASNPYVFMV